MSASLQHYLTRHASLRQLRSVILQQQDLLQQIKSWLPMPLSSHCHSAALQQTRLVLAADSSVWADQLRYQTSGLLQHLRTTHPSIAIIKVCARPVLNPSDLFRSATCVQHRCTHRSAQLINNNAQYIQDPVLNAALKKLAHTLSV